MLTFKKMFKFYLILAVGFSSMFLSEKIGFDILSFVQFIVLVSIAMTLDDINNKLDKK